MRSARLRPLHGRDRTRCLHVGCFLMLDRTRFDAWRLRMLHRLRCRRTRRGRTNSVWMRRGLVNFRTPSFRPFRCGDAGRYDARSYHVSVGPLAAPNGSRCRTGDGTRVTYLVRRDSRGMSGRCSGRRAAGRAESRQSVRLDCLRDPDSRMSRRCGNALCVAGAVKIWHSIRSSRLCRGIDGPRTTRCSAGRAAKRCPVAGKLMRREELRIDRRTGSRWPGCSCCQAEMLHHGWRYPARIGGGLHRERATNLLEL